MTKQLIFLLLPFFFLYSCTSTTETSMIEENQYHIIPQPAVLTSQKGQFVINENTVIVVNEQEGKAATVANLFLKKLQLVTGYQLAINNKESDKNAIIFTLDNTIQHEEGYALSVNSNRIIAKAKTAKGLFYAYQTLRQLLPIELEKGQLNKTMNWSVPAVEITDSPRFVYRGGHFDVSRHFFDVAAVKMYIDQLAYHKMNYFHWHLTDDQGWRIEIKQYPKLTEIGAFRDATLVGHYNDQPHQFDGERYGGFYTQEDIKEVIEYAADRFITVIPEIELPGHAQASIAAYPELGCTDEIIKPLQIWGVSDHVYCPTETTFTFLENVLTEVMELFPGKYIHVGGDECPKTKWKESKFCQQLMKQHDLKDELELQSYFIQRMEKFINAQGKQIIGWDEILEGGLAPNATVMSWRGIEGGIEAAKAGHEVVMTPTSHCYLDYYQSDHPAEPLAIGGLLPLEKVYNYEPIPEELSEEEAKYILGTQGNIWTEYIPTVEKLQYMLFPRLSALSEVAWSPKESKDFDQFIPRISVHLNRLKNMGIHTANHLYDLNVSIQPKSGKTEVQLSTLAKDAEIYYTLDETSPTPQSLRYNTPIQVDSDIQMKAQAFVNGEKKGRAWEQSFKMHKAAGKNISLITKPHPKYSGGGNGSVINGVLGSNERYGDAEWFGFDGDDFSAIIEMNEGDTLKEVVFRFFKGEGQWIYLPKYIVILTSLDGTDYKKITAKNNISGEGKVVETTIPLDGIQTNFLKIIVENYGIIPEGEQGGGNKSWLFIDEIRVN